MFKKKTNIENNIDVKTNIKKEKTTQKKTQPKKEKQIKLGVKHTLNLYTDIIEKLINLKILTTPEISLLLEGKPKGFSHTTIKDLLLDIHNILGKDKEKEVLEDFFHKDLGYKVITDSALVSPSASILDIFNEDSLDSLDNETIDKILEIEILPIQQSQEGKIKILTVIGKSPEIPKELLNRYKKIFDTKKILDLEFVLVDITTYNDIHNQLINKEYDFSL